MNNKGFGGQLGCAKVACNNTDRHVASLSTSRKLELPRAWLTEGEILCIGVMVQFVFNVKTLKVKSGTTEE